MIQNSTPCSSENVMRFTAFEPPPPTPSTCMKMWTACDQDKHDIVQPGDSLPHDCHSSSSQQYCRDVP